MTPRQIATASERELGDFRDGAFVVAQLEPGLAQLARDGNVSGQQVRVVKTVSLEGGRLDPSLTVDLAVTHNGTTPINMRLGLEWALHVLGGGGNPQAWYDVAGERTRHDGAGEAAGVSAIGYGNDWVGISVAARPSPAADAWWSPIETVSNSEAGFERVYQGSTLVFTWPFVLQPGETKRFSVRHDVTVNRDHAAGERAAGERAAGETVAGA